MEQNSVKFVKFSINASGYGCVNTNGNVNPDTGTAGDDQGNNNVIYVKKRDGKMYISSNSVRGYLFKNDAKGMMLGNKLGFIDNKKVKTKTKETKYDKGELVLSSDDTIAFSQKLAQSYLGLVRGYMLVEKGSDSIKRSSPLMVTDWINTSKVKPNKHEIMVNHLAITDEGKKDSNSLFVQETWGGTHYEGKAVISIENLQFISLDNRLGQQSVRFTQNLKKKDISKEVYQFIDYLIQNLQTIGKKAGMSTKQCAEINVKHGLFVRSDSLFQYQEEGILLNNAAMHALVLETQNRIKQFSIIKSKAFVHTDSVKTDFLTAFKESPLNIDEQNEIPSYHCFYKPFENKNKA